MQRKLYRSTEDKMLGGVLGGIAEYSNVDATILRVIYVILSIVTTGFPGILIYIACMLIIPKRPEGMPHQNSNPNARYNAQTGRYEGNFDPYTGQYTGQFNGQYNPHNGAPFTPPADQPPQNPNQNNGQN